MIKFKFFNKDINDDIDIKIESDKETIEGIQTKASKQASKQCIETYNESVVNNIKERLMLQYLIDNDVYMGMAFHKEHSLIEAICNDIASEMGLLKTIKGDSDEG